MNQISARCNKPVNREIIYGTYFAKQKKALQHLSYKLAPRYNYILDFSAPLNIHSEHGRFRATIVTR
jgi:hypothetical protein